MKLVRDAAVFATLCHHNTFRKYHNTPYITHPQAVAEMVMSAGGTPEQLAAAWLHDVVEDCGVAQATIDRIFGSTVGGYVKWLTKFTTPDMGNREFRMQAEALRLSFAPDEVQTIKLADMIHNTADIVAHDPKFARVYLKEKQFLLDLMTGGSPWLRQQAAYQIQAGIKLVG